MVTSGPEPVQGRGYLLIVGVILFNAASAYTTKRGLDLIFQEQEGLGVALPWVLSIGCAAFLVYLTFEVAARKKSTSIAGVVLAYSAIASFSVFCNFSFIYTSYSGRSIESAKYSTVRAIYIRFDTDAREHLKQFFGVKELEESLSNAKIQRDFEKTRPDRPGEGGRWLVLDEQVKNLEGEFRLQKERLAKALVTLDNAQSFLERQGTPGTAEEARRASRLVLSQLVQTSSYMGAYGFEHRIDLHKLQDEVGSEAMESNLRALFEEVGRFIDGKLDRLSTYRFMLSLFLSVVLDTALFIVVAARRPEASGPVAQPDVTNSKPPEKRLWDEKMW